MITHAICHSYGREILEGIHQPGDTFKIALFTSQASLDAGTKLYSTNGSFTVVMPKGDTEDAIVRIIG